MKRIVPLKCWLLFPLVSAVHVWDYEDEVRPSTPSGFGRRVERSTFSDIFETLGRGNSIDFALEKALSITPRSKVGQKSVRFPEPSPFTTPRPPQSPSPTPQSFSDIFQPRPPLVLREHSSEQLQRLTTTDRIDEGTSSVPLTTLRAILDHVRRKEKEKVIKEEESQYDYEYVYDYVEVDDVDDVSNFGSKFSTPVESNEVTNKFPIRSQSTSKKPRPKIVPRQRVVPPKLTEKKQTGFVSFVTPQSTNLGSAVTKYSKDGDTLEIINPPIVVFTDERSEQSSTRRIGYNYKQPQSSTDSSRPLNAYNEPKPEEPLTPSLQSVYETPITQSTFTNLVDGAGVTYREQTPEEPLTPSLQSVYDPPPTSRPNKDVELGYKYSSPDGPQIKYSSNQGNIYKTNEAPPEEVVMVPPPSPAVEQQQPPESYNPPPPREQPPPSTYSGPTDTERPPRTTTRRPTTYSAPKVERPPATYAPSFINDELPPYKAENNSPPDTFTDDELPPYKPEDNLPSYEDNDNGYKQSPSIFVTPTPPPIVIPPKTMPGRRLRPSLEPRVNSEQNRLVFSTLLPPLQPLRITTSAPPTSKSLSSFSDIFSQPDEKSQSQRTSYKNNSPPPSYVAYNQDSEEDSYGQPLGQPISNSHSEPELYDDLRPPSNQDYPEYIDYNDVTISGLDPRLSSSQTVSDNPPNDISQKLKKKETPFRTDSVKRFQTSDNSNLETFNVRGQNNFDETTRIKGILRQETTPFGRLVNDNNPPPSVQFADGYSAPIPEEKTPSVFSEILEPPETTSSSYIAPIDTDNYQSPPRRPDSSYTVSVEPTITDNSNYNNKNDGVNNGHSGSLKIDINVNINKEQDRPSTNSHGPAQTTDQPANLPTTQSYASPVDTEYVGPTTTTTTNSRPAPAVFSDILEPADSDYKAPPAAQTDGYLDDGATESYQAPTDRPVKVKSGPDYPRNYGSKLTDDRPNDIVAPDYNIDVYQDDLTAPDISTGYDIPSAPVVSDYYNAPVVDDVTYEYEDNYFGHEAPGYEEFVEYDYHTEKPRHKHKKVKPFVDFGSHPKHKSKKHRKPKHRKPKYKPAEPIYDDDHYFGNDFYQSEPHIEKPDYQEETFYEPIEKPHYQEDSFYEPLEKPVYDSYYDEPYDDYHVEKPHYQGDSFYEPLEKPVYNSEPSYEEPLDGYQDNLYIDPVPKGYYDKTTDLIPELRDVIRPLDWNVHDFSSWRRILDKNRFGGTLRDSGGYGKELKYREPEIYNEVGSDGYGHSYSPENFEQPLYYEDYYHDYEDGDHYPDYEDHEAATPYTPNLYDYDSYEPSYYQPKPLVVPEPFDIPFDDWLDTSGVGAFGLPSVKYSTYASPPAYQSYGGRDHSYDSHWVPSERPPSYGPSYLRSYQKTQVEVPEVRRELYHPPRIEYRRVTPRIDTSSSSPGSIWTGLASFADSLGEKNHYRGHSVGMVSSGSDGMVMMGSEKFAVMVKPPSGFNATTDGPATSRPTTVPSEEIKTTGGGEPWLPHIDHNIDPDSSIPVSLSHSETTNSLGSQSSYKKQDNVMADFDHYILDSSVIGSTLSKMSKMLKTYLK